MEATFIGGRYAGRELDLAQVEEHAIAIPVASTGGKRLFVLMPVPESWSRLCSGEITRPQVTGYVPYERVETPRGVEFHDASKGRLDDGSGGQFLQDGRGPRPVVGDTAMLIASRTPGPHDSIVNWPPEERPSVILASHALRVPAYWLFCFGRENVFEREEGGFCWIALVSAMSDVRRRLGQRDAQARRLFPGSRLSGTNGANEWSRSRIPT